MNAHESSVVGSLHDFESRIEKGAEQSSRDDRHAREEAVGLAHIPSHCVGRYFNEVLRFVARFWLLLWLQKTWKVRLRLHWVGNLACVVLVCVSASHLKFRWFYVVHEILVSERHRREVRVVDASSPIRSPAKTQQINEELHKKTSRCRTYSAFLVPYSVKW